MVFKKIVWNPVDTKAIENFEDIAATVFEEKIILPIIIGFGNLWLYGMSYGMSTFVCEISTRILNLRWTSTKIPIIISRL